MSDTIFQFICQFCYKIVKGKGNFIFHLRGLHKIGKPVRCENCGKDNYVTDKNRRNMPEKFRIKKYCPKCRSHHSHKEGKISKG